MIIRKYRSSDLEETQKIWNEVVEEGNSFPQIELLGDDGEEFFQDQDYVGVAEVDNKVVGFYTLHPNNIGRCGHLSNASYGVSKEGRGKGIGKALVQDSLKKAKELGYKIHQFNAVVKSNQAAHHLYKNLGFIRTGEIPGGFLMKDGSYEDIVLYHYLLDDLQEEKE